jgi:hypothetical protein
MSTRFSSAAFILLSSSAFCQSPASTGAATTHGACSPANSGDRNVFNITCGIGREQGDKLLEILNRITANQLDPTAVMGKLDELKKDMDDLKNRPTQTNTCPHGICVSGGVVDHPTVNNTVNSFQPIPPRLTWKADAVDGDTNNGPLQGPDSSHPGMKVAITVAGRFQFPMFAVQCNRPCAATEIVAAGVSSPKLYETNSPNVPVAGFAGMPAQVEAGTTVWVTVRSKDEQPIRVLDVAPYVPPQ